MQHTIIKLVETFARTIASSVMGQSSFVQRSLLLVCLLSIATPSAFASTSDKQGNTSYHFTLASEYFLWEEYIDNDLILDEQGMRVRVGGDVFYHSSTHNKHGISARAYLGRPDYTGQDQNGSPASSIVDYAGAVVNLITQHTLRSHQSRQLAIHALLGTEYWIRNIHDTTNGLGQPISGALETYTVFHCGIGLSLQVNSLEVDLTLKMPLSIYEYVEAFDSYLKPKPRPSISTSITRNLSDSNKSLYIRAYFDSLLMGASNTACGGSPVTCFYQPESRAYTAGIEIGRRL